MINKTELFHTSFDFVPNFGLESNQWPHYDQDVYQQIVWDREYFLNAGFNVSFTLEVAHAAFYRVTVTFDLFKAGFGVKEIAFWEEDLLKVPDHYCGLYYLDSRMLSTTVAFETNTKPCNLKSYLAEQFSYHWDSRQSSSLNQSDHPFQKHLQQSDDSTIRNHEEDENVFYDLGDVVALLYDYCHYEGGYEDMYFLHHELHHKESWLPSVLADRFSSNKEVLSSSCFW